MKIKRKKIEIRLQQTHAGDNRCSSIQSKTRSFNHGRFSSTSQTEQEWVCDKSLVYCTLSKTTRVVQNTPVSITGA